MKMIQVEEQVHAEAKTKAKKLGMSLKAYIRMLVARDK